MLRELLLAKIQQEGLSYVQAADVIGVHHGVLARWLTDKPLRPSPEHAPKIARFLNLRRDDVMELAGWWTKEERVNGDRRQISSDPVIELCIQELRASLERCDRDRLLPVMGVIRSLMAVAVNPMLSGLVRNFGADFARVPA